MAIFVCVCCLNKYKGETMQQNPYNNFYNPAYLPNMAPNQVPNSGANAVSINIISPQAFATNPNGFNTMPQNNFYSMYGQNQNPALPLYPQNYNNLMNMQPMTNPINDLNSTNAANAYSETNLLNKTAQEEIQPKAQEKEEKAEEKTDKKEDKKKTITPLTDDYVKSLENYLNNDNPKIRLIGAKDLMERFKEDDNRRDNPSLIPLLNKTLKDNNAAVRFLGLTTLQLGYSVGNDETVQILQQIKSNTSNKMSEDYLIASEILLSLSAGEPIEVKEGN